ncbi:MAG: ABC transporter permease [Actinobacteria bacterium]|jgi:ABC-type dipeptide/oligopeptide/nickel transport system permease subunit|nr:ABC transporter permease [Actinomycetota bacterium]
MTAPLDTAPLDDAPAVAAAEPQIAGRSLGQIAWGRLRRDKVALVGAGMIIFFVLVAIFAPLLCAIFDVDPETNYTDQLDDLGFPDGPWANASWDHPFGVEPGLGRDIFARTVYGARYSLTIALLATVLTVGLGVVAGIIAGFRGGWMDTLISRSMDILLAFPVLLFSIAALVIVGQAQWYKESVLYQILFMTFVIGFFGWPYIGRIIRGQVLSLREKEFVDAARSLGASTNRILFKELLPNLLPIILVYSTLIIPTNILAEAALSFLGVGLQPPTPTWGQMLSDSRASLQLVPSYVAVPGMAIFLCVLAFNLFGDGLRDAFDPKGTQ